MEILDRSDNLIVQLLVHIEIQSDETSQANGKQFIQPPNTRPALSNEFNRNIDTVAETIIDRTSLATYYQFDDYNKELFQ